MTIEFVYYYQKLFNIKPDTREVLFDMSMLQSPENLAATALLLITERKIAALEKISCCVYTSIEKDIELPEWYVAADAVLWFKNGELHNEHS